MEGNYAGNRLRILVADDGTTLPYIRSLAFADDVESQYLGLLPAVSGPRLADADADIVVVGANQLLLPLYYGHGFRLIPKWVRLYLPLTGSPDEMISNLTGNNGSSTRRNVRDMKEAGFAFYLTNDPDWFDEFYSEWYEPYAQRRFGDLAATDGYNRLRSLFLKGRGLVITRRGAKVAGVIVFRRGKDLWFHRVGVRGGDQDIMRSGASAALYYYTMLHAYEMGCAGVDFGHSRPLASDGVLRYKLKWGMRVLSEDDNIGIFAVATPGATPDAEAFLSAHPFYELTREGVRLR